MDTYYSGEIPQLYDLVQFTIENNSFIQYGATGFVISIVKSYLPESFVKVQWNENQGSIYVAISNLKLIKRCWYLKSFL